MRGVRKLACLSIGYSLAVFAAHYVLPAKTLIVSSAVLLCLILPALLLKGNARLRAVLMLTAAALGLFYYGYRYDSFTASVSALDGKTQSMEVMLTDYPKQHDYGVSVSVQPLDGPAKGLNTTLYDYEDALPDDARPGDILKAKLKTRSAAQRYGEETDADISAGVYLTASLTETTDYVHSEGFKLRYLPQELAKILRTEIESVFPEDSRSFMLALMIGNKEQYYDDESLSIAMSVAGLAHVVAVSGMHVSFLVAFLELILGKSRRTSVLCLGFVWIFVLMSGASPSAIRAGFMLSVALLAPVFDRENDRLTSLTFALAVILGVNPFAAGSISLQLSFAAIAGIFAFSKRIFDYVDAHTPEFKRFKRLKLYLIGAFSNSIAVTAFSFPVMAARFGYISLMSPLTNILCLWAISLLFVGGYAVCAIGVISTVAANAVAMVLSLFVKYIVFAVLLIAEIPFAELYTQNLYALLWAVLTYALFAASYHLRDKKKKYSPVLPTVLSVIALVSVFAWTKAGAVRDPGTATVLSVGNGQCIVLTQKGHTAVIDCGSAGTAENAGDKAAAYLKSHGRNKVDYLVITHLHRDHADGAAMFMELMDLDTLVISKDAMLNADDGIYEKLRESAERNDVNIHYLDSDTELLAGDIALNIYAPYPEGDKNERGLMLTALVGGKNILITGDVSESTERKLTIDHDISDTDILIVGHHGSKSSTSFEMLNEAKPDTAVISVGFNSYGHPTDEVLHKLDYFGINTYRTDVSGNITISAGD